ncbi:hypothetical protein EUGRSUZ_B03784 [Eucalyptus grandis]|uniref:Uncharacterized protein n=2 Tax=Eucalyptus grandis TaxID=71139 RepID=A0ACC3LYW7_EUCGR|nr:hypothetical protein EUGRSUZ_B03784 [Eucalyptus grandis]
MHPSIPMVKYHVSVRTNGSSLYIPSYFSLFARDSCVDFAKSFRQAKNLSTSQNESRALHASCHSSILKALEEGRGTDLLEMIVLSIQAAVLSTLDTLPPFMSLKSVFHGLV